MSECNDCGEGPDVTQHACWCEEGHLLLVAEVERLRAGLAVTKVQVDTLMDTLKPE